MAKEIRALPDSDSFVTAHPDVAKQLNTAFSILNGGELVDDAVSSLGVALRHSLMDLASGLTGETTKTEKPIEALQAYARSKKGNIGSREMEVLESLITLAETTLKLAQRPTHIRNEAETAVAP